MKIKRVILAIYFYFRKRILFEDKFGLSYYLYKNTRPQDTFQRRVRTDDTTVLTVVNSILTHISKDGSKKNLHCIDVGAYIGVVSLMMLKAMQGSVSQWRVHSFEPSRETFIRLTENIELNHYSKNIELNNIGVSDNMGTYTLSVDSDKPGQNHLVSHVSSSCKQIDKVKIITLYQYLMKKEIDHVAVCKIDAEGVDHLVLKGLGSYLEECKVDYFILEYESAESQEKLKKLLDQYNYSIYYMVRNMDCLVTRVDLYPNSAQSLINILAVSPLVNTDSFKSLLRN